MRRSNLTEKQKRFADYYIETGNIYQSALKAGYSENYAKSDACKILENPSVSSYIAERMKPTEEKRIATGDEVMEFFTAIMRGEIRDAFDLPPSLADRKDAAKELAKRTVDVDARRADVDIIQNMQTVADILFNSVPNRNIEEYE